MRKTEHEQELHYSRQAQVSRHNRYKIHVKIKKDKGPLQKCEKVMSNEKRKERKLNENQKYTGEDKLLMMKQNQG